jgi:hypothetical protein
VRQACTFRAIRTGSAWGERQREMLARRVQSRAWTERCLSSTQPAAQILRRPPDSTRLRVTDQRMRESRPGSMRAIAAALGSPRCRCRRRRRSNHFCAAAARRSGARACLERTWLYGPGTARQSLRALLPGAVTISVSSLQGVCARGELEVTDDGRRCCMLQPAAPRHRQPERA